MLAIYGATGYTGQLVAREARRRGQELILSGRDGPRLHRLAESLGGEVSVRVAPLDDRDALRHAFGDADAVVNCAGPFLRYGEPVVRAAVETATHYVDTTGEQPFMKKVLEDFDDAARAAEVTLVPGMGFDYVPGDLLCRLVGRAVEPLRELVVAYSMAGFEATRGTLRSALEMFKGGDVVYEDGAWRPSPVPGRLRASFTFPEPLGRRAVSSYPSGEILTVPRHTETDEITSLITSSTFVPNESLAPLLGLAGPPLGLVLRTPLRRALSAAIGRLPEGPDEDTRRAAQWLIVAHAFGRDGREAHGVVRGSDVYGLTAVTAVHGALLLTTGEASWGALPPAAAFDPATFLDVLGDHGVSYAAP